MTDNANPNNVTTINVTAKPGDEVNIENHNGPTKIRVLVVRYDREGGAQQVEVNPGATVSEAVGATDDHQEITVNGVPASADQQLSSGDKVAVSPDNPEGGC